MRMKNSVIIGAVILLFSVVRMYAVGFSPLITNHEDYYTNSNIIYAEAEWNQDAWYNTGNANENVATNSSNGQAIKGGSADWWFEKDFDLMPGTYRMSALVRYRDLVESPIGINKWYTYSYNGEEITMKTNPETGADWELASDPQQVNYSWQIADELIKTDDSNSAFKFLSSYRYAHVDMFKFERIDVPETVIQVDQTDASVSLFGGTTLSRPGTIGGSCYFVKDGYVSITPALAEVTSGRYYVRIRMRAGSYASYTGYEDIEVSLDGTSVNMKEEKLGALWAFGADLDNYVWWHSEEPVRLHSDSVIQVEDDDGYWNLVDAFEFIGVPPSGTLICIE